MKKIGVLIVFFFVFISCKQENKSEVSNEQSEANSNERTAKQSDGLTLLKGEFVYYADAAVLQTHREIYAVIIDDKMHELNKEAAPYKDNPTDFVMVEVRGKITPKPLGEEGWDYRVAIKEILNISKIESEESTVIKLEQ